LALLSRAGRVTERLGDIERSLLSGSLSLDNLVSVYSITLYTIITLIRPSVVINS
jgi:hypothetical protein